MSDSPLVSVIIPAYNRADTIRRALDSVLAQTFQDYEILLVDDASTDDTVKVAQGCRDQRLRIVRHEQNRGAAAARNTGVREAVGRYVAFFDSDDEWLHDKLAEQLHALARSSPQVRGCTTGLILVQGEVIKEYYPEPIFPLRKKLLWGCDFGPGTTLMVERDVFDQVGFMDERMPRLEDWDWLMRYAHSFDLVVVHKPLASVFRNTKPEAEKVEAATLMLVEKYRKDFDDFGWWYGRKALARRWREVALFYIEGRRNLPKERHYFWKTLLANPFQPPGIYLDFIDALLGTSLKPKASQLKANIKGSF